MNILGQAVRHKKFGKGVVTDFSENKVTVCFSEGEKIFLFPDAFPQYLILKNEPMQRKIEKLNEERMLDAEAEKKRMEREKRYRNQRHTMKIPLRSQIAYNVSEEVEELEFVHTGCHLSGQLKGKPRIPSSVQPNSAILFSACENGNEEERCIVAIAMADECFWGRECTDGQIKLHSKYKLILAHENRLSFWKYFKRETFPARWGNVPFKYFQNQSMRKILFDICEQAAGTEQEEATMDFYRYFCSINRISDK